MRIHPVKIGVPFRAEIKFITQSVIIHLSPFVSFITEADQRVLKHPGNFRSSSRYKLTAVWYVPNPIHLLGRSVQTVQYLKLYLLIRIIVVCHIQTGHEVTHVLYHVTIFVNINRIQIKFYTTIRDTLLSGKNENLFNLMPTPAQSMLVGTLSILPEPSLPLIQTLTVTVTQQSLISLHFDTELLHFECALIKSGVVPFHIEITVHIKIEIELVRFFFDTGDFFKQTFVTIMKSLPEDWAYKG